MDPTIPSIRKSGLVIAVGTYDGVLAGWEFQPKDDGTEKGNNDKLSLTFATAVHDGSIRSLCMAGSATQADRINRPGNLLSTGYDETLKTHDWIKRMASSGEVRTPSNFGTPVVSAFAPPPPSNSTHCIVGFSGTNSTIDGTSSTSNADGGGGGSGGGGKLCIYKKRDWTIQHVLSGHDGGVSALSVHPTGKLALSGGICDGKLKLWDLTKGRLAFCYKLEPVRMIGKKAKYDSVTSIIWSTDDDGAHYAFSYGSHATVREVSTGKTLLDVELPSRVNQITLMHVPEGMFVVAACNDGSLPVLAVEELDDHDLQQTRRAILAIEPVESHLAREERFKCIQHIRDYYVVTANSAGVVSLMNLQGAVKMITTASEAGGEDGMNEDDHDYSDDGEGAVSSEFGNKPRVENDDDVELAVDIIDSVRLGTGARITCLTAWYRSSDDQELTKNDPQTGATKRCKKETVPISENLRTDSNRKRSGERMDGLSLDAEAVKRARSLVEEAKKLTRRKDKQRKKNRKNRP
jgi:WD40 repeat protein